MILAIFYIIAILAVPFFTSRKSPALLCLLQQKAKMSTCSLSRHTRLESNPLVSNPDNCANPVTGQSLQTQQVDHTGYFGG